MAQPSEDNTATFATDSGISSAATRLEQAFYRLESAARRTSENYHSLKADHEKLNLLLHTADKEIARLKEITGLVTKRLDRTISNLEKME